MSAIQVLILQHGHRDMLKNWWEEDTSSLVLQEWEASSALWPESLLIDDPDPMEVFLCLDGESLAEGYEAHFIRRVVQQAHKSMWGAKVFVVVDESAPLLTSASQSSAQSETPEWMEILRGQKIADILRSSIRGDLSKAVRQSSERGKKIHTSGRNREWKCLVQTPPEISREQQTLLSKFRVASFSKLENQNCLVVLTEEWRAEYLKYLKRKLPAASGFEIMIGFVDRVLDPPEDLETFCTSRGYELVRFHGLVELYFFLLKLNRGSLTNLSNSEATFVRTETRPSFRALKKRLLVTHSYVRSEKDSCLIAANDSWELTKELRDDVVVEIYPAIKCVKLASILKQLDHLLAWVHIGHGDHDKGLIQAGDEVFKSAENWLDCFAGYKSSLALAMFSSCKSVPVAERFARSGTYVAIGFTNRVHKRACKEMTTRVVQVALDTNGSTDAILEAFRVGRKVLGTDDPDALPVAFRASQD